MTHCGDAAALTVGRRGAWFPVRLISGGTAVDKLSLTFAALPAGEPNVLGGLPGCHQPLRKVRAYQVAKTAGARPRSAPTRSFGGGFASRRLTRHVEASSIAIDVSASQFPQLPVPRHSPEQVEGYRATNAWLERHPLREHKDLQEQAEDRLSGGQKNYSTVSRDPCRRL